MIHCLSVWWEERRTVARTPVTSSAPLNAVPSVDRRPAGLPHHAAILHFLRLPPLALSSASLRPILWNGGREGERHGVASQLTKVSFRANKNKWITENVDGAKLLDRSCGKIMRLKYQFSRERMEVSDEEVAFLLWGWLEIHHEEKRDRSNWVHPMLKKRMDENSLTNYISELKCYPEKFANFVRLSVDTFHYILSNVEDIIRRRNTNYRKSITPEERLFITLRKRERMDRPDIFQELLLLEGEETETVDTGRSKPPSHAAFTVRNFLVDYFSSEQGRLPWQDAYAHVQ
uniref:Uncharacterized protein n=1 Tax=Timema bartmani TaxID=61472 RepID=A0A7R9HVM5_9NEOP|nr:unnamed protein product [Timema bartmani]